MEQNGEKMRLDFWTTSRSKNPDFIASGAQHFKIQRDLKLYSFYKFLMKIGQNSDCFHSEIL